MTNNIVCSWAAVSSRGEKAFVQLKRLNLPQNNFEFTAYSSFFKAYERLFCSAATAYTENLFYSMTMIVSFSLISKNKIKCYWWFPLKSSFQIYSFKQLAFLIISDGNLILPPLFKSNNSMGFLPFISHFNHNNYGSKIRRNNYESEKILDLTEKLGLFVKTGDKCQYLKNISVQF